MIVIVPMVDSEAHLLMDSACQCGCDVDFNDGELTIIHNQFDESIDTEWLVTDYPEDFEVQEIE
jgi:hypothetical protein